MDLKIRYQIVQTLVFILKIVFDLTSSPALLCSTSKRPNKWIKYFKINLQKYLVYFDVRLHIKTFGNYSDMYYDGTDKRNKNKLAN